MSNITIDFPAEFSQDIKDSNLYKTVFNLNEKPQKNKLLLKICQSDHANDKFLKVMINNLRYHIYPSRVNLFIPKQSKGTRLENYDHYEFLFGDKSLTVQKNKGLFDAQEIKYPLRIEISGGEMMMRYCTKAHFC